MKKLIKRVMAFLVVPVGLVLLAASCIQDIVTPCFVDKKLVMEADANDIPMITPYSNLWYGNQVMRRYLFTHTTRQINLARQIEDNNLRRDYLMEIQQSHISRAEEWKTKFFSPSGFGGMMMAGAIGSLALWIPPPGTAKKIKDAEEKGRKEANNK